MGSLCVLTVARVATSLQTPVHRGWTNTPPVKPFTQPGPKFSLTEESPTGAQTPEHFSIQGMTVASTRSFGRCLSKLSPCSRWWWSGTKCPIFASRWVPDGRKELPQGVWRTVACWLEEPRQKYVPPELQQFMHRQLSSNTVMQKWGVNAAEVVLIIQQLLCNERQRQNRHKSREDLGRVPCTAQEEQRLWSSSISSLCIMSGRSSQRSLALCRCEYLPLPGSPGSARRNTSGICTRILSFC